MPATQFRATVERIDILSYNVRGFRFKFIEPPRLEFKAGQFIILNVPKASPPAERQSASQFLAQSGPSAAVGVVKRAYSIASPPYEPQAIDLCIQHVEGGIASTYFWQLKEGDTVSVSGPHGNFLLKEPLTYDPVFIATGTGVAPLRGMIKHLLHVNCTRPMWLLFGTRYEHALLYESEFRSLAGFRPNFHYVPTVSRPKDWHGEVGHVQQTFQKYFTDFSNLEIYLCGWLEVVKAVCKDLDSFGVPKEKLHYEEWA
jgi:NAD(P)H-flavin reductase